MLQLRKGAGVTTGGRRHLGTFVKGAVYAIAAIVAIKVALVVLALAVSIFVAVLGLAAVAAVIAIVVALLKR